MDTLITLSPCTGINEKIIFREGGRNTLRGRGGVCEIARLVATNIDSPQFLCYLPMLPPFFLSLNYPPPSRKLSTLLLFKEIKVLAIISLIN